MPHYNVMVFGFQGPKAIWDAGRSLGLNFAHTEDEEDGGYAITDVDALVRAMEEGSIDITTPDALQEQIDAVFVQAVNGLPGYRYIESDNQRFGIREHIVDTPFGRRSSSGLGIALAFDNFECDDTVEDAILGFYLTSRYRPAFLDFQDPCGGMRKVNADHKTYIESLLKDAFPTWKQAQTFVHQVFA